MKDVVHSLKAKIPLTIDSHTNDYHVEFTLERGQIYVTATNDDASPSPTPTYSFAISGENYKRLAAELMDAFSKALITGW